MRNPLPGLLGLMFPACAHPGADGVPPPPPLDLMALERPRTPNHALAGPTGKHPRPVDALTEPFPFPPETLFQVIRRAMAFVPNLHPLALHPAIHQAHYVARSRLCNFPDLLCLQALPGGRDGESHLVAWSRSLYGHHDFRANLRRIHDCLAEIAIEAEAERRKG